MRRLGILAVFVVSSVFVSQASAALDEDWTTITVGDFFWAGMDRSGDDLFVVWLDWSTGVNLVRQEAGLITSHHILSGGGFSALPKVHVREGDVHVAWVEDGRLYVRTSRDRGASFDPAVEVSGPFPGGEPAISSSGGRLYIAWPFTEDDEIGGVALVVSKDRGSSFSAPTRLDENRGHGDTRIASHGNRVHVFWDDAWRNDDPRARIRTSGDHGKNFGPLMILSPYESDWPTVSVGSIHAHANRVFVSWSQEDWIFGQPRTRTEYFARSLDRGRSFEAKVIASGDETLQAGRMGASKGHVAFAWERQDTAGWNVPSEIFLRESFDAGATFGSAIDISQSPATASHLLGLEVEGERTHVLWREAIPALGGFQWFRAMTIENGIPGPFVHLMDDTINVDTTVLRAGNGHIDILVSEWTPAGYRLLYRHGTGTMH